MKDRLLSCDAGPRVVLMGIGRWKAELWVVVVAMVLIGGEWLNMMEVD